MEKTLSLWLTLKMEASMTKVRVEFLKRPGSANDDVRGKKITTLGQKHVS